MDIPLVGGRMSDGVVRRGGTVRRPVGPWTPTVHSFLRHLDAVGFDGCPRVVGIEDDVEILSFIDGDVAVDPLWQPGGGFRLPDFARTDDALVAAGRLLRRLHQAADGFDPPSSGFRFHPHPRLPDEVISHGDIGPWNTVYRDGVPVAFIDWDSCQPIDPIVDVALAAWAFVPLAPADRLIDSGFPPALDIGRRLRLFVDAYGLATPWAVLPALQRARLVGAERVRFWPINADDAAAALDIVAADLRWLHLVSAEIKDALE